MSDPTSPGYLALKAVMMPRDTNVHGTIFGGVILSYIDQAGAVGAEHEIRKAGWPDQPIVTVAMDSIEFHRPVFVGEIVSFWTRLVRVGETSMTIHVTVLADRKGEPPIPSPERAAAGRCPTEALRTDHQPRAHQTGPRRFSRLRLHSGARAMLTSRRDLSGLA